MGGMPTGEFLMFAKAQTDVARIHLARHAYAGLGLCRCGRLHPCDERRHWLAVHQRYRAFLPLFASPSGRVDE